MWTVKGYRSFPTRDFLCWNVSHSFWQSGLRHFFFCPLSVSSRTLTSNPDSIPFTPAVNYPAGSYPLSIFCADLDGDGDLDLAVANAWSNNVSILKNNGDGTFQPKVDYEAGNTPTSLFCADLDQDGNLDLAVTNEVSDNVFHLKE